MLPRCRTGVVCAALGLALAACDDTEDGGVLIEDANSALAAVFCGGARVCDCESTPYASEQACRDAASDLVQDMVLTGEANHLIYDGRCMERYLDEIAQMRCEPLSEVRGCRRPCNPYHGTLPPDAVCKQIATNMSNCDRGMVCKGICVHPTCEPVQYDGSDPQQPGICELPVSLPGPPPVGD